MKKTISINTNEYDEIEIKNDSTHELIKISVDGVQRIKLNVDEYIPEPPTKEERQKVHQIIEAFQEYAYNNKCDFSLLYKPEENETEVTFKESGFIVEFVVSWNRKSELENIELYDSESDERKTISFKEFIKCYKNFIDQDAF